jgi:hypothetical protein
MMLVQNRPVIGTVAKHSDAGDLAPRVVVNRRAGAKQTLHRIGFHRRWAQPHHRCFRTDDVFRLHEAKTAETTRGLPR